MSGAELKTTLVGLALPPKWFGKRLNVTVRTVTRWFSLNHVSPLVHAQVELLCDRTLDEMRAVLEATDTAEPTIILRTYRTDADFVDRIDGKRWPSAWHRALIYRVMDHLRSQEFDVRIEYR